MQMCVRIYLMSEFTRLDPNMKHSIGSIHITLNFVFVFKRTHINHCPIKPRLIISRSRSKSTVDLDQLTSNGSQVEISKL